MSVNEPERQALGCIEDGLAGSDPRLAAMLNIFSRLAAGEQMPVHERHQVNRTEGMSVITDIPLAGRILHRGHDGRPAAQGGGSVEPFDTTRPNIARVWDYWLGGKDNFAADRELAEKMLAVHPVTAQMARENRQFLGRAVSYVAARGVRQFIDVGAGLPTVLNTHDIARHTEPDARVAYVDNDPIVISHARSLLAKSPGVIAVPGDMRDPGRILADPGLTGLIDLAEPVCVILSGVLHFADPAAARDIAADFARAVVSGSYLIISVGSGNPSEGENFTSAYTAARIYIHSRDEIQGFFGGLGLVPPGVVSVRDWSGDRPALNLEPLTATFAAGVARKVNAG